MTPSPCPNSDPKMNSDLHASATLAYGLVTARYWSLCVLNFPSHSGYCSRKNVPRSVDVAIQRQSARWAVMLAVVQCLWATVAALGAVDTCSARINTNESLASFFSFVSNPIRELAPCGIGNTLAEPAPCHTDNIKILNCDQIVCLDNRLRQFVRKVSAAVCNFQMNAGEPLLCFKPTLAAALLSGQRFVCPTQLSLHLAKHSRVVDLHAVRKSGKRIQANINSNARLNRYLFRYWLAIVNQQLGKPAVRALYNAKRFDYAVNWAQISTTNQAKFWNGNPVAIDVSVCLPVIQRIPSALAFESREPWLFPILHSPKECVKRLIEAVQSLFAKLLWKMPNTIVVRAPYCQHLLLSKAASAFAATLPNLNPMLKEVVPNAACRRHPRIQRPRLFSCRIESNRLNRKHVASLRQLPCDFQQHRPRPCGQRFTPGCVLQPRLFVFRERDIQPLRGGVVLSSRATFGHLLLS